MANGGITGEPVLSARFGSYASSVGKGNKKTTTSSPKSNVVIGKSGPRLKASAEAKLDSLVNKARNDRQYANVQGAGMNYGTAYDLAPKAAKDFVDRQLAKTGGKLNEAAKARIAPYLTDRTQYQLDLDKFRKSSPQAEAAYVKRFPKTAAFEKILNAAAEGIVGIPGKAIKQIGNDYMDGVQNMIEKISGTDAKNIEIAKDKDTDIDTIVNNLQRNIKKERDDGKARGMTEADLTAMYGDPIDITTGDDIFGAELIGMDELEDDSPLNIAPTEGIAQSEREQKELEGGTQTRGLTPIRLDTFPGKDKDEGLFDLSGSDEPGQVSAFDLDPNKSYYDLESQTVITPDDIERDREFAAREQFLRPFSSQIGMPADDFQTVLDDQYKARDEGFPNIDVTQEGDFLDRRNELSGTSDFTNRRDLLSNRDLINNPIEGQATAAGKGLVYADGTPIMEFSPTPLFESEMLDDETIRKAIEGNSDFIDRRNLLSGKANGGQIFGNQNMSTFDKLKAIADGIADNK